MRLSGATVLVTGAGGFIGSHLTERLIQRGASVRALLRYSSTGSLGWLASSHTCRELEIVLGNVEDRDSVRKAVDGVDVVFHLAALIGIPYSYQAPASYVRTNVEGTLNVLQAALDEDVDLVVQTSTSEVYGSLVHAPMSEDHPQRAQSPYAATKIAADRLAEAFHHSFGLPTLTVRPFNTYGPRQSARAIIPTIIARVLAAQPLQLGNLHPTRDFTYVSDTVEGFIKGVESERAVGQVVNLGTGREVSVADLANRIMNIIGHSVPLDTDPGRVRPPGSEVERLCSDFARAQELFGWTPEVSLEDGLRRTIEWFTTDGHARQRDGYAI